MTATALALVLSGALIHAAWNLFAKQASGGPPFVWLYGVVSLIAAAPFGLHAWQQETQALDVLAWIAIAGSAVLHLVYSLTLQKGYQAADFSIVYPTARGTGPMFAVVGAIVFLGETPSVIGWVGILAIVGGILLVSSVAKGVSLDSTRLKTGVLWGVLTGMSIAAYTVVDGWAVKSLAIAPVLYYVLGLSLRTALLAPKVLGDRRALREQWRRNARYIVAVGLLSPLAYTLILFAMTMAPLSYVAPARELSMLIGVLIGAKVLRESFTPARAIGTGLMLMGVVFLSLAR